MKKITTDTLIIGAGPAGLAAAVELLKAGKDFIVIEKSNQVGGLSKTYTFTEGEYVFRTDNGPHRFFSKNKYLYSFIENILKEKWLQVTRYTRQYIGGVYYQYPIQIYQALKNLGFRRSVRIVFDYIYGRIYYGIGKKPIHNFREYVYAHFGKTLGEFNMINYTEKIWGIPAETMHTDWAKQRIKGLYIFEIIRTSLQQLPFIRKHKKHTRAASLVDVFYYPEYGTGLLYESIADKIRSAGKSILLNTKPTVIHHTDGRVTQVVCTGDEEDIEITCNTLIESIPLTECITLFNPAADVEAAKESVQLTYRNQVYLFITIDKDSITKDQWIYFPEKHIPFARISEMKNFSTKMSPPGMTSLFIEFFCSPGDAVWNMSKEEVYALALPHLIQMNFFTEKEVRNVYHMKESLVYPVYDTAYKAHLDVVKGYMDSFSNLYYIGRPGRFRYNNQDHSLEMGICAARSIIDGKRYSMEDIGNESEYYEKGEVGAGGK